MPIAALIRDDGSRREFPEGGGEMTRRVAGLYRAAIEAYIAANADKSLYAAPG